MPDITKITVTVAVNHTEKEITVKRTGDRLPIAKAYTVSPSSLAGCYRDAAAYFLDLAASQINRNAPEIHSSLQEQAELMLLENKPLFSEVSA